MDPAAPRPRWGLRAPVRMRKAAAAASVGWTRRGEGAWSVWRQLASHASHARPRRMGLGRGLAWRGRAGALAAGAQRGVDGCTSFRQEHSVAWTGGRGAQGSSSWPRRRARTGPSTSSSRAGHGPRRGAARKARQPGRRLPRAWSGHHACGGGRCGMVRLRSSECSRAGRLGSRVPRRAGVRGGMRTRERDVDRARIAPASGTALASRSRMRGRRRPPSGVPGFPLFPMVGMLAWGRESQKRDWKLLPAATRERGCRGQCSAGAMLHSLERCSGCGGAGDGFAWAGRPVSGTWGMPGDRWRDGGVAGGGAVGRWGWRLSDSALPCVLGCGPPFPVAVRLGEGVGWGGIWVG